MTAPVTAPAKRVKPCVACKGTGQVKRTHHFTDGTPRGTRYYVCTKCLGTGQRIA